MTSAPLLDTHAWVWWVHGDERLGRTTLERLDRLPATDRPAISDISLWEVATLVSLGRLNLKSNLSTWLDSAAHPRTVQILPISAGVAVELSRLPSTLHRDPADRVIISTSRVHGKPLLTRDQAIVKSGLVRLWNPGSTRESDLRLLLPRLFDLKDSNPDPNHPDAYFQRWPDILRDPLVFGNYRRLEEFLARLDEQSWIALREQARGLSNTRNRGETRGWRALFDVFNEAIAYSYLLEAGYDQIAFIPPSRKKKSVDLTASMNGGLVLCEVKTINISAEQADRDRRVQQGEISANDAQVQLSEGRLGTLRSKIKEAMTQIQADDPSGTARPVIFVAINFDDRIGDYHEEYFEQIDRDLDTNPVLGAQLVLYPTTNLFDRRYVMRNAIVYVG